jgi:diguanylate cyclase
VARFRTKESEREKFLSEQMETMQQKMVAMEAQEELVKAELREQRRRAMTDVLTQLPNREALQERLDLELQRWRRYGNPLSLAMLDIDFFKRFNDSYGHKAGDRVLQLVAKALRDRLRQTDFIARFGGEEFVVVLPETSPEVAKEVLDDLRIHIRKLPFHFRGEPVFVTFSAGVAGFEPDDQSDSVFDRADRALYQAKNSGRDLVCNGSDQG